MAAPPEFDMLIDDAFWIGGRIIVLGVVSRGEVQPGMNLQIQKAPQAIVVKVVRLEAYAKSLDIARSGDSVGILLDGVQPNEIVSGLRLTGNKA